MFFFFNVPSDVMGLDAVIPGQNNLVYLMSTGFLIVVAGMFGAYEARMGAVVVAVLGAFLWYIGFLPLTWTLVSIGLFLATLAYMTRKEEQGG